jgi:hypothetical protein
VTSWLSVAALLLTVLTLFSGLLGLAVRYGLLPYLRDHLVIPVKETHHQVTANSHSSPLPTIMDKLDDISKALIATNERLEEHLDWSNEETAKLWKALIVRSIVERKQAGE